MIFTFPSEEKLHGYNRVILYLKSAPEKPVVMGGKVLCAKDDGTELVIETETQFAAFLCDDISGIHFTRINPS